MTQLTRRTALAGAAALLAAPTIATPTIATPDRQRTLRFVQQSDLGVLDPIWVDWWEVPGRDLLPMLNRRGGIVTPVLDRSGYIGVLRFNHLQPPFDNPAPRRALLGAASQSDYMIAANGEDPSNWRTGVGYFAPGSPMASDAGLEVLTGKRDLDRVRRDITAAGYRGETIVMPVPTDFPRLKALADIGAYLFARVGLNVEYQATDWGTMMQRLAKTEPVDQGGWPVFHTYWSGLDQLNPAVNGSLRGNGKAAGRGWPTSPKLEALRDAWLVASDPAEQRRIAEAIQLQALQDVPYIPLRQLLGATAYRTDLAGVRSGFPLFWNVRRSG